MKHIALVSLLLGLGGSTASFAQNDGATLEVLPHSSDAFVLTLTAPSVSRPIVVDRTPRIDVRIAALAHDLDVTFISPKKARYSVGQNRPDFESNTFFQSEIFVALTAGDLEQRVGNPIALSLAAFEGAMRLRGVRVDATLSNSDGASTPVVFRDDGTEADFTTNDGIYTALVELNREGDYDVRANVRGLANEFHRTATTRLHARRASASLAGTFIDRAADDDGDGLFDAITISPAINVSEAAKYSITVALRSSSGNQIQKTAVVELGAGMADPVIRIPARTIRENLAEDGPYAVQSIVLERHATEDVVFVDRRSDAGMTYAYRMQELQRERLRVPGRLTMTGVDTDGNSLFDQLKIEIDIEVDVPASYLCSAGLTDRNKDHIADSQVTLNLAAGMNRVAFTFDGEAIGKNGVDGPYAVALDIFGPASSLGGKWHLLTPPISAAKFQRFRDTTAPTLSISVTPVVLWPVDHQMVEIVPFVSVKDDQDPAPSVQLDSIVSSEEPNQRADGNTSVDMRVENGRIFLRAERSGNREDRVYTLTWSATDRAGNVSRTSRQVTVPHDRGN